MHTAPHEPKLRISAYVKHELTPGGRGTPANFE